MSSGKRFDINKKFDKFDWTNLTEHNNYFIALLCSKKYSGIAILDHIVFHGDTCLVGKVHIYQS
jgi:hypothetical protein